MGLDASKIKSTGKAHVQQDELEIDNYPCRVAQVIDTGVRPREKWDTTTNRYVIDDEKAPCQTLMVTYEFTDEFCKDAEGSPDPAKPRWLSESINLFNLDVDLATSTKRYKAIDPTMAAGGDWIKLVEAPCMVMIAHKPSGKAKIGSVSSAGKRVQVGPLVNPSKTFLMDEPDLEVFGSLPDWLQEKIKEALNYKGSKLEAMLEGGAPEQPAPETPEVPEEPVAQAPTGEEDLPW